MFVFDCLDERRETPELGSIAEQTTPISVRSLEVVGKLDSHMREISVDRYIEPGNETGSKNKSVRTSNMQQIRLEFYAIGNFCKYLRLILGTFAKTD